MAKSFTLFELNINIPCEYVDTQSVGDDGQESKDGHRNSFNPEAELLDDPVLIRVKVPTGLLDGGGEVTIQGEVAIVMENNFGKVHFLQVLAR